jgi:hypothetical protein
VKYKDFYNGDFYHQLFQPFLTMPNTIRKAELKGFIEKLKLNLIYLRLGLRNKIRLNIPESRLIRMFLENLKKV